MKKKSKHQLIQLFLAAIVLTTGSGIKAQVLLLIPSDYNGYNVSCFGAKDGRINMVIRGCVPPYTIKWNNKDTAQNISNLSAGDYFVHVTDMVNHELYAAITLAEPQRLKIGFVPSDYRADQRHLNVIAPNTFSSLITANIEGGVMPYDYEWLRYSQKTFTVNSHAAGKYSLTVNDANGCTVSKTRVVTQPFR